MYRKDKSKHSGGLLANTKLLYNICTTVAQRLRRWFNIVQMLWKGFVFTGLLTYIRSDKPSRQRKDLEPENSLRLIIEAMLNNQKFNGVL